MAYFLLSVLSTITELPDISYIIYSFTLIYETITHSSFGTMQTGQQISSFFCRRLAARRFDTVHTKYSIQSETNSAGAYILLAKIILSSTKSESLPKI